MARLKENQLTYYESLGKTLRAKGYELKWNKPEAEGTLENPRMPLCCVGLDMSAVCFSVYEETGIVAVEAEEEVHATLEKRHKKKALPNG